ncbi:MAG: YdcF family protein [Alphaproteobacteria bacterium]|nr:YdcF family protein [Alphaproteobacteria bacterium]
MEHLWFVASKVFWSVMEPATLLLGMWVAGSALLFTPWRRLGRWVTVVACLATTANAMLPIGQWALKPLEDRFPPLVSLPPRVDGIIVLGGVIDDFVIGKRGVPRSLYAAGSPRLDAFLELARRYPAARHVFTGGSIELINARDTEADVVRRIFARLGVDTTRVIFEDQSRNTWENARFSFERLRPEPEEQWIIITSARHMPRAVGVFRHVGWRNLIPFPVDFATDEETSFQAEFRLGANLQYLSEAIREYVGLIAYYYLGRTTELLPGPN